VVGDLPEEGRQVLGRLAVVLALIAADVAVRNEDDQRVVPQQPYGGGKGSRVPRVGPGFVVLLHLSYLRIRVRI
jgi:hypothetical protein